MDNDYNEIATRIKNRRNKNNKQRKDKKITFKILNRLLGLLSLILAFLIYAYKDPDASLINSIFKTNINLSSVNAYMNKITKPLLSFLNININSNEISDQEVNAQVNFIEVGEYTYTNSNNTVYSIGDGTILNVSEDDYGYIVYAKFDNGYEATYENLVSVNVASAAFSPSEVLLTSGAPVWIRANHSSKTPCSAAYCSKFFLPL